MERWERRERKLFRRRDGMRVTGIGLKKVLLPAIKKRAEEAAKAESERQARGDGEKLTRSTGPRFVADGDCRRVFWSGTHRARMLCELAAVSGGPI